MNARSDDTLTPLTALYPSPQPPSNLPLRLAWKLYERTTTSVLNESTLSNVFPEVIYVKRTKFLPPYHIYTPLQSFKPQVFEISNDDNESEQRSIGGHIARLELQRAIRAILDGSSSPTKHAAR